MDDFTNKYPYTDFHEMNLDWFLDHFDDVMKMIMQNNETVKGLIEYIHSLGLVVIDDNAPAPDKVYSSQKTQNLLNNKVDKIAGYGLSQNDFTNTLKTKLEGIEAGANRTVVADTMSAYQTDPVEGGVIYQALNAKVDKVAGKQLSQENYTSTEKTKLAGIYANATKTEINDTFGSGLKIGTISIDDVDTDLNVPVDDTVSDTSTYPLQNKAIYDLIGEILPEVTKTGNPISINDAFGFPAKSCEVSFAPVQDLHGQSAPYPAGEGKNLFKTPDVSSTSGNVTLTPVDANSFTLSGSASSGASMFIIPLPYDIPANTDVTFSLNNDVTNSEIGIRLLDTVSGGSGTQYGTSVFADSVDKTGTVSQNWVAKSVNVFVKTGHASVPTMTLKIQVETSSTATDYAPYSNICPISGMDSMHLYQDNEQTETPETTYTEAFPNTAYGGKVDFVEGKLTIEWVKLLFNAYNETLFIDSGRLERTNTIRVEGRLPNPIKAHAYAEGPDYIKCDTLPTTGLSAWSSTNDFINISEIQNYPSVMAMSLPKTIYGTTPESINTALGTYPIEVCYILETPQEITLTEEVIALLKGTNVLWTDGDNITLKYSADIKEWVLNQ